MITREDIATALKNLKTERVYDVKVTDDGFVYSHINSRIHPDRPYALVVDPSVGRHKLAVCILTAVKISINGIVPECLLSANSVHSIGGFRITPERMICFQATHICRADDDNDPSPELLKQLVSEMIWKFRINEMLIPVLINKDASISTKGVDKSIRILPRIVAFLRVNTLWVRCWSWRFWIFLKSKAKPN